MKIAILIKLEEPFDDVKRHLVKEDDGTQTLHIWIEDALEINTIIERR